MDIHEIQERSAMIQQPIEYFSDVLFNSLDSFFTGGQYWPSGIVVARVRHQVCPRDNSSPVQARITKFGP